MAEDAGVIAIALLAAEVHGAESMAGSIVKAAQTTSLRTARSLLKDAAGTAEVELRSRGVDLTYQTFSKDELQSEETLMKVRRALFMILGRTIDSQQITDCISEMQNAGILFRERSDCG